MLFDKDGYKISGFTAGRMIAKRFDEQPGNEFPWISDVLGSDWMEGPMPANRHDYRRMCIDRACMVYDPSAQHC